MSRKGKRAQKAKKAAPAPSPEPTFSETVEPVEPVASGSTEWVWLLGAIAVVAGVSLFFQLNVNRVFDVPKATILKVGGCLLFAAWLLNALYGSGVRWRSAAIFAPPVAALTVAVAISTLFSIDVATSFNGVYERQFGLQGFLACVGLFFLTATSLHGKRGAWLCLGVLASLGGTLGVYALYQAFGWDPWPFFWNRPFNKVYSFLGNATFAGNALALITPMITVAAGVATAVTVGGRARRGPLASYLLPWALAFAFVLFWQLVPARAQALEALALDPVPRTPPAGLARMFVIGVGLGPLLLLACSVFGSWGPPSLRFSERQHRHWADAAGAGALSAMVVGILIGLLFTRTRGAWVGTGVAVAAGLVLMPRLADGTRWYRTTKLACWGGAGAAALAFVIYVGFPQVICGPRQKGGACWLYAETIRSIPAAFDPSRTDHGKGQGTRRYLWAESPRVLYNHTATLQRAYDDRADYANNVDPAKTKDWDIRTMQAPSPGYMAFDRGWRSVAVWLFGIGIETYRYAFMSHKSMRLEALDPMTNHDNPHNNYLYVLASFGLLGLAAYIWLLWRLLSQAFRRFIASPQSLLIEGAGDHQPGLIGAWRFEEAGRSPQGKLILETPYLDEVTYAIQDAHPDWTVTANRGEIEIRDHDPETVLSALAAVRTSVGGTRVDRAMAFGVVTSFFSYAVYSIAGFDSVACSVFLFFLLGVAAALFRPNHSPPDRLIPQIRRQWADFRGISATAVSPQLTRAAELVLVAVFVPLLLWSAYRATVVYGAERALVGEQRRRVLNARDHYEAKIDRARAAVRANPYESFYKQSLGNAYGDAARFYATQARKVKSGDTSALQKKATDYRDRAEQALYAALDHAWAPENVFISLFQLQYQRFTLTRKLSDLLRAERALERALVHSPHLGAVRANLATLQLERKALDKALTNALWVTRVSPNNPTGWRVAGRAYQLQGDKAKAKKHLDRALKAAKGKDARTKRYLEELKSAKTTTKVGPQKVSPKTAPKP